MSRDQRTGILFILLAAGGYALLPIFIKRLFSISEIEPIDAVFWRFAVSAPALWIGVALRGLFQRGQPVIPNRRPLPRYRLLLMGTFFAVAALCAFVGLDTPLPASTYVVLFFTFPAFVAIFSLVMGERLRLAAWVALVMTMVGVMFTVPDFANLGLLDDPAEQGQLWLGIGLSIFNAVVVAVYFLLASRVLREHTAMARASAWTVTGTLGAMLLVCLFRGNITAPENAEAWLYLLAVGVLSTALPIFALNKGISKLGAARAAIINTLEPLMTMVLALLLLHEQLTLIQWVGGGLIIGSIIVLESRRPSGRQTHQPAAVAPAAEG